MNSEEKKSQHILKTIRPGIAGCNLKNNDADSAELNAISKENI